MKKLALVFPSVWLLFALGSAARAGHDCDTASVIDFSIGISLATPPIVYGGGYYASARYYSPNYYQSGCGYPVPNYYPPRVVVVPREPVYLYPADYGYYDNHQDRGSSVLEAAPSNLVLSYNGFYYPRGSCYFQEGYYRPYERYQGDYWFQENRQWRHHFYRQDNWHDNHRDSGRYDRYEKRNRRWDDREEDPRPNQMRTDRHHGNQQEAYRDDDRRRDARRLETIHRERELDRRPGTDQLSRKASEARTSPSIPSDRPFSQHAGQRQTRSGIPYSLEPAQPHNSRRSTEANRPKRSHH